MKVISTKESPAAIGPYEQGYVSNGFIFTSAQLPIDPVSGAIPETIEEQADLSCRNVQAVLHAGGASMENVIKTTCYLTDMNDFAAFNAVYGKHFTGRPARCCVAVRALAMGVKCEIEAIAEL